MKSDSSPAKMAYGNLLRARLTLFRYPIGAKKNTPDVLDQYLDSENDETNLALVPESESAGRNSSEVGENAFQHHRTFFFSHHWDDWDRFDLYFGTIPTARTSSELSD